MTKKQRLAKKKSNKIRLSFDIDDTEYARILLLKKNKTYAQIARKEGKIWTAEKIKGQMKKVYNKLNKNRPKNLPRICCHLQIFEILEMVLITHLF